TVNIPPERFMAYMKNGMTTVRHARGIVVGCAEAGKTTLLYRLIGKSLDKIKEIKSTRGLHVYEHIFFVRNGDLSATENESFKKPLIRIPASELEQKEQNSNDDSTHNKIERETGNSASMESIQADMNAGKEFSALAPQKNIIDESRDETIDQDLTEDAKSEILYTGENERNDQKLARDVMEKILDARENETSVSMFDFAGQFAYYACHQIYMRSEAFYVLVMDMSKAFQDVVSGETTECEGSIFSTWTYKDYLYFWLDSIKSFSGTSAQVLTVATHTEGKTGEEKDSFWESLWALVPEEDKTRLYDRDFALGLIEMNEEGVHTLQSLKKSIAEVVSQGMDTKIEVPSAWALLEHLLQKAEKPILSISDINEENKKLPEEYQLKSQEEIYDFLSFFHSNGMLLFFMEEGLRTHAIFGIQWFSNAFSKLIADKTHINRECQRRYIKDWNHFNATGKLSDSLIDALWKEESSYLEHKAALMSYMERLRMLVSIEGEFSWYVPCMNNKPFTHDIFEQTLDKSSILGFRFTSFAMFVYYRLIAYCMSSLKWKVQLDKDKSQCLYHTAAIFETQNHTVIVGIIDNDIQIQVLRIKNLNPKVSCEIGKTIEIALTELTKTFDERKTFLKGYKCLNRFCSIEDLTFIPEKELSGVQCNCPIVDKHEIDAHWTLSFWKENVCSKNSGSSVGNLDGRATASSTTDDNILCFSCEEKHDIGVHYWEKNSKRIRTESEYLFAKGVHSVDVMTSIIKADVSRSVGLILRDGISEGTGFRVGEKYIMTCLHVIEKFIIDENSFECDRFCIQFGKTKVAQNDEPRMKFNFEPILHYTDKEYDVAILEMKTHQERDVIFAPPLTSFGKMSYPSEIHLIGHTGGVQMKEDSQVYPNIIKTDNYEDKRIKELSDWSKKNLPEGIDYYSVLREAPQKVLFNTTFAPGSSGSPGFMIKEQRAYTVLIVSAGVPKCYYENGVHVPANKRVEYGYALEDLNAKMQKSSSRIKALASEIFGECFRTS
ncbi:uncharacterized protein LOC133179903, partial [Saccostrea echinata]|uniref:uncharacterized protein LOC133179903 n=1 Tax=Saccostrea echinata TaxID=191078 RepID=UPI002A820A21